MLSKNIQKNSNFKFLELVWKWRIFFWFQDHQKRVAMIEYFVEIADECQQVSMELQILSEKKTPLITSLSMTIAATMCLLSEICHTKNFCFKNKANSKTGHNISERFQCNQLYSRGTHGLSYFRIGCCWINADKPNQFFINLFLVSTASEFQYHDGSMGRSEIRAC